MNMIQREPKASLWLALGIIIFSVVLSYGILVQAQVPEAPTEEEIGAAGITFPVAELGNCGDKTACKAYCNEPSHMPSCVAFAKAHGLMNEAEASRAEKFSKELVAGNTPGGCSSPQSCEAYCSDITHMDECIAFAERQGIRDNHIDEAKKIRTHLKSGGTMPGGCTSHTSCEAYCSNFEHADECLAFAEKIGINIGNADEEFGPKDIHEVRKIVDLMKRGEMPGGCRSREACDAYCSDRGHFEECIAFAEKAGFVDAKQAELARKAGGAGPGSCRSEATCRTYCNDPAHQEECFKFAEEHGLISQEDLKHAKEGFVRLKQGLEQAPPEVAECLKSKLGPNIIQDIQAGTLTPGPEIGERVRGCFESFGHSGAPTQIFREAPQEVLSCVRGKLGTDAFEKLQSGQTEFTPELGDTFRVCFQSIEIKRFEGREGGMMGAPGGGMSSGGLRGFIESAPPEVMRCFENNFGGELTRIKTGEPLTDPALRQKIETCFREFTPHPRMETPGVPGTEIPQVRPSFPVPSSAIDGNMIREKIQSLPPHAQECVRNSLGDISGGIDPEKARQVIETCMRELGTVNTQPVAPIGAEPVPLPTNVEPIHSEGTFTPSPAPTAPAPFCNDIASCTRACSDPAGAYFNTPECEKMRSGMQSTAPQSMNVFDRFLGAISAPFLNVER